MKNTLYYIVFVCITLYLSGCIGATGDTNRYGAVIYSQKADQYRRRHYPKLKTREMPKQKTVRYDDEASYSEWKKYYRGNQ